MPCTYAEGRDNRVLLMHIPASPRLHANQADEVFWRVGAKSRKLTFDERLQLMYDKGERYYEDCTAYEDVYKRQSLRHASPRAAQHGRSMSGSPAHCSH